MELKLNQEKEKQKKIGIFENNIPSDRAEYITCPAILCRDEDAVKYEMRFGPTNIPAKKGIVFTGYRHQNIIEMIAQLGFSTLTEICLYGFVTSKNRFVTRFEGMAIARAAGQTDDVSSNCLTSDHLY